MHNKVTFLVQVLTVTHKKIAFCVRDLIGAHTKWQKPGLVLIKFKAGCRERLVPEVVKNDFA